MLTVLVTGGLGFVGSHTTIQLLKRGFNVVIVDSLINSSEKIFESIKEIFIKEEALNPINQVFFEKIDLRDYKSLNKIFIEFKRKELPISSVIHCAGLKSVEESVSQPLSYWDMNINSSLNLLKVMRINNCNNLIFSSSATIYDTNSINKLDEKSLLQPLNPYGNTKLSVENLLRDLFNSEPNLWRIANLRYFNPAGAHISGLIGEASLKFPTNLFPLIVKVAKKELKVLSIFGNDWPTPDGTCIRDYIHIMDLADAHVATLDFLLRNKPQNIIFNIGTGKGTSVIQAINTFSEINNIKIPVKIKERRKGDNPYLVACNKFSIKKLDWNPTKNLKDICVDCWRYENNKF